MRMRNVKTGSIVTVSDEAAPRMRGYVPVDAVPVEVDPDENSDEDPNGGTPAGADPEVVRPHNGASREAWVTYAKANGLDDEALKGRSRDDLVALFPAD